MFSVSRMHRNVNKQVMGQICQNGFPIGFYVCVKMQLVMIAAAQWFFYDDVCLRILSVRTTLYLIPMLLWLVLIHVELRNCPVPGTKPFGLLPLCSVVNPI